MKKVLVLEDESSIRSFIVINLRRAGYDVIEAESGEEALEKAISFGFPVILKARHFFPQTEAAEYIDLLCFGLRAIRGPGDPYNIGIMLLLCLR